MKRYRIIVAPLLAALFSAAATVGARPYLRRLYVPGRRCVKSKTDGSNTLGTDRKQHLNHAHVFYHDVVRQVPRLHVGQHVLAQPVHLCTEMCTEMRQHPIKPRT